MAAHQPSLLPAHVVVDYTSPAGPRVVQARGTLIANSRDALREVGVWDRYVQLLPAEHREAILYGLPASWVPIETALAHYNACDQLTLNAVQIARIGALTSSRVIDTFMGSALRVARSAGADSLWMLLKNHHRIYDRMWVGGGVTVLQTGPKDLIIENHGQPLVSCRYWRMAYLAYMEAMGMKFAKFAFVKLIRPRVADPHTIAIASSWV